MIQMLIHIALFVKLISDICLCFSIGSGQRQGYIPQTNGACDVYANYTGCAPVFFKFHPNIQIGLQPRALKVLCFKGKM